MENAANKNLWYTRRGDAVRGPFPAGQISRYILLGRIRPEDEVSHDRLDWRPVGEIAELQPRELADGAAGSEALMLARRREDERLAGDRRGEQSDAERVKFERRRKGERRQPEADAVRQRREAKTRFLKEASGRRESAVRQVVYVALLLAALLVIAVLFTPARVESIAQCGAAPAPGIDWSNCHLEGLAYTGADLTGGSLRNADLSGAKMRGAKLVSADLSYARFNIADLSYSDFHDATLVGAGLRNADLSYANFKGADLSYADLSGANLGAADLTGARLDNAIWVDKRECAPGSVGRCIAR